jgi:UDP-N-acetylglucosamine--N-acetylmuramyl-(pentapeptide) pyrophosphoryl-undecaprenol N-acetylglucosamine transferase
MNKKIKVLMSGGGTGGHIFPAIAIAEEIRKRFPDAEFLFIGALGKMEMEKVPQAGFRIEGLPIAGFDRGNLLSNFKLPFKIIASLWNARKIVKNFQPDFAVGTGGYASGPALWTASKMGIPIFVQEQNSLPGKTNVFLSKKAKAVFTAYPEMENFFQGTSTYFLGNPVRQTIIKDRTETALAKEKLGLDAQKLTILSVGGSLGSRTLNTAWKNNLKQILDKDFQIIWQTGSTEFPSLMKENLPLQDKKVMIKEFVQDMATAYSAADVIVSRAGAIAISELAIAGKPVLLVPFPFAAEDHQTKNAQALVEKNAAKMVKDTEMDEKFWTTLTSITDNEDMRNTMSNAINFFAKPKATEEIVDKIIEIIKK